MEGPSIRNDVPGDFLEMFTGSGYFSELTELAREPENTVDLHFRNRRGKEPWATLYLGTSKIVDIHLSANGDRLKIERQKSTKIFGEALRHWRKKYRDIDDSWGRQQPIEDAVRGWKKAGPDLISGMIKTDHGEAARKHTGTDHEGYLQAGIAKSGLFDHWTIINRESIVSFENGTEKDDALREVLEPVDGALERLWSGGEGWTFGKKMSDGRTAKGAPSTPSGFGNKLDALGVDNDGNLLAIEVKGGYDTAGVGWTPAQVLVYKGLLDLWREGPEDSFETLSRSLEQRRKLGLAGDQELAEDFSIIPVIVIGPIPNKGSARTATERMRRVSSSLEEARPGGLEGLRVYQLEQDDKSLDYREINIATEELAGLD